MAKKDYYVKHYTMKQNRLKKLKQTKCKCEMCGWDAKTIHHIDESLDNHKMDNLCVVCSKCHTVLHSIDTRGAKYKTSKYLRMYGKTNHEIAVTSGLSTSGITTLHKAGKLKKCLRTGHWPKNLQRFRVEPTK